MLEYSPNQIAHHRSASYRPSHSYPHAHITVYLQFRPSAASHSAAMDYSPAKAPTPLGRYRVLSPKCGLRISPLQLGAMSLGEANKEAMGAVSKEQAFALLDAFVAAGGNCIDTSNNYQNEQSEAWLGEWMKARGNRDQIIIATKYTVSGL